MRRLLHSDKVFDAVNVTVMVILLVIFAWPLWFVIIASVSDQNAVTAGQVLLWPKGFQLEGYEKILNFDMLWTGFANSTFYTVVGTTLNMFMSICLAYPLSDKNLIGKKWVTIYCMITMYFGGGLIPHYLLYRNMGIIDTRWAMIFPSMLSIYNALIIRSYFQNSIPGELREAATIDGANAAQYLMRVVLPLSKPVFAVVGLYYLVGNWNNYSSALYYIYNDKLVPIQTVLRRLLIGGKLIAEVTGQDAEELMREMERARKMEYGIIIVAALPVLAIYPFVQKYFVKGTMIGAIKG